MALLVAKRLAALCGPYVVYADIVPVPVLVEHDTDFDAALSDWEVARARFFEEQDREMGGAEGR